jgi:uncharacterized protein YjbI with pentapeptide repeats
MSSIIYVYSKITTNDYIEKFMILKFECTLANPPTQSVSYYLYQTQPTNFTGYTSFSYNSLSANEDGNILIKDRLNDAENLDIYTIEFSQIILDENDTVVLNRNSSKLIFSGSRLHKISFDSCIFNNTDNNDPGFNTDFSNATISNCILSFQYLEYADFTSTTLQNCDFQDSILQYSNFTNASLEDNLFVGVDFRNCIFTNTNFSGSNITQSNLQLTDLRTAIFTNTIFSTAQNFQIDLTGAILTGNNLSIINNQTQYPLNDKRCFNTSVI